MRTLICSFLLAGISLAQTSLSDPQTPTPAKTEPAVQSTASTSDPATQPTTRVTLPTGTKVLLVLKNRVSSRNARVGDGVYLETAFPVTQSGRVVIPAGTYVQGSIDKVKRSGRVKGRAEVLMHFTTLIYPNGYTLMLPGALDSMDSQDNQRVKDEEGTVQADSTKGRDAGAIALGAGGGALSGAMMGSGRVAGIGAGAGAALGVLTTLFTRGEEVILDPGSTIEMVLQRPVDFEMEKIDPTNRYVQTNTPQRYRRLEVPGSTRTPTPGPTTFPPQPGVNR